MAILSRRTLTSSTVFQQVGKLPLSLVAKMRFSGLIFLWFATRTAAAVGGGGGDGATEVLEEPFRVGHDPGDHGMLDGFWSAMLSGSTTATASSAAQELEPVLNKSAVLEGDDDFDDDDGFDDEDDDFDFDEDDVEGGEEQDVQDPGPIAFQPETDHRELYKKCSTPVVIDFDKDPKGNDLEPGSYVSKEWKNPYGLRIQAKGRNRCFISIS